MRPAEGSLGGTDNRIPSLDGLRAVSIALVILGHVAGTRHAFGFGLFETFGDLSNLGVRVFFVISGFLITTLLLAEQSRTGRISLKLFYFRRVFRIFPAAYAYISAIAFAGALGLIHLKNTDLLSAITYTTNYNQHRSWYIGHLWSLAVEEQFYLLWPAILALAGVKRGLRVAAAAVLVVPLVRIVAWCWLPEAREGIGNTFETVADALAAGCLLAGVHASRSAPAAYLRFLASRWFALVPAAMLIVNAARVHTRSSLLVGETALNLCAALCVDRFVRYPTGFPGNLLNWRPVAFAGVLSYSLYLWQQPFLDRESSLLLTAFPVNLMLTFVAAFLCYRLIEKPFLDLRARLETRWRKRSSEPASEAATS